MKRLVVPLLCFWFPLSVFVAATAERGSAFNPRAGEPIPEASLQTGALIINEYLADPPDSIAGDANGDGARDSTQDEFVELVNAGLLPLDVGGFTISDAVQVRFTFPAGKLIPAGEAAVVFGGGTPTGSFGNASANGLVFAIGGVGLSLNNAGDTITVKDNLGATLDSLTFGSAEGNANQSITRSPDVTGSFMPHLMAAGSEGRLFSPGARANGRPFVSDDPLINSISPNAVVAGSGPAIVTVTGENFQDGSQARINGTPINTAFVSETTLVANIPASITDAPGAHTLIVENPDMILSNPVTFTVLSEVGINEFLADPPDGIAGDANGDGARSASEDEFVEIVNRASFPIDIGGFSVSDAAQVRFTFPLNTIVPAGEAAVIFGGGTPTGEFGNAMANDLVFKASLSLNNGGDTISLKNPGGATIEEIVFSSAQGNADQSINRDPEILGTNLAPHSALPDSGGRLFSPGAHADGSPFTTGPRITRIIPDSILLANAPFNLTVEGSGFDFGTMIFIDSAPVSTRFVNANEVIATVPAIIASAAGDHRVEARNAGGNRSNAVTLTIVPPPPVLRSVTPRRVLIGSSFTLFASGENFTPASRVLVEGEVLQTTFIRSRELSATVPAQFTETTGLRRVRVRNSDGKESNELAFEVVLPDARIAAIAPSEAIAGGPAFMLTVMGENFRPGAAVFFDHEELTTNRISDKELKADVPASLISDVGLRIITVANADGSISNEAVFRVLPVSPVIHSIDPERANAGSDDLTISIIGEKFQPGAIVHVTERRQLGPGLVTRFISGEMLEALLPALFLQTPGDVPLIVVNPDGGVSNFRSFKILIKDPLVINEFLADPPDSTAGDANGDGTRSASQDEFIEIVNRTADPFDISGYRLFDADALRHVFAPGTVIPPFEAAVIFGGGTPTGNFGNAAENGLVFRASSGGLSLGNTGDTIRLEDPTGAVIQEIRYGAVEGSANQSANRNPDADGAAFSLHTNVSLGGRLLFSPGAKATGEAFTIKPRINALAPAKVRAGGQTFTLKISGENLLPGATALFNETALETLRLSDRELEAEVSAALVAEGGAADVRVRNPRGELSGIARFIIFDDPPRIASITPQKTGTGAMDFEIAIAGERFQRGARVTINGEPSETIFIARDRLMAIAPGRFFERAAMLEVQALNADGNRSNAVSLTVENGPLITRAPKKIKAGRGAVEIEIGGLSFQPGIVLVVADSAVETGFESETLLRARIPAEMTANPGELKLQARNPDGGRSNIATVKVVQ